MLHSVEFTRFECTKACGTKSTKPSVGQAIWNVWILQGVNLVRIYDNNVDNVDNSCVL